MFSSDLQEISDHWNERAEKYSDDTIRVDSSKRSQLARFNNLLRCVDLREKSILDVGCGVGDLYGHLQLARTNSVYHGIDIAPKMIERACQKYPGGDFAVSSLFHLEDDTVDVTAAISIYSVKFSNSLFKSDYTRELLEATLRKQFAACRAAAHMSLLSNRYRVGAGVQTWSPAAVLDIALSITPWVRLDHAYLPHDFSVTLYREQQR